MLVPLELLLEANYAHILRKFGVLFFGLGLQKLELFLDFVHVRLEGEPEIVLVLTQHIDKFLVVVAQRPRDLLKRFPHLPNVRLEQVYHRIVALVPIREVFLHVVDKRFKNCTDSKSKYI